MIERQVERMKACMAELAAFAEKGKDGIFNLKKQYHPTDISPPSLRRVMERLDESKLSICLSCPHVTSVKLLGTSKCPFNP